MPKSTEMQRAIDNDNSVRVDLATEAIDTPMHIDGEVIDAEPPREVIEVSAPPEPPTIVALISPEQSRRLHALLGAEGLGGKTAEERQARIDWLSTAVGRTITTSKELTSVEAGETIQMLEAAQAQP
jgi:recombination protein RecT